MVTLKPGFNLAWYVTICVFQECFILAYLAPRILSWLLKMICLKKRYGTWDMFRIDMTRWGWKTYIYTCRYVSMYLCIFYIEYSFHTDIRYPSISIYTKVCGHPNVCKHSAQIWALCDRGELRCGTTDLGKSKKSLYRTRCDDISLGNLTVISILSRISRMLVVYVMTGVFFCLNVGIHRWSMLARCCCNWWTDEPILQIHLSHKKKLVVKGI